MLTESQLDTVKTRHALIIDVELFRPKCRAKQKKKEDQSYNRVKQWTGKEAYVMSMMLGLALLWMI